MIENSRRHKAAHRVYTWKSLLEISLCGVARASEGYVSGWRKAAGRHAGVRAGDLHCGTCPRHVETLADQRVKHDPLQHVRIGPVADRKGDGVGGRFRTNGSRKGSESLGVRVASNAVGIMEVGPGREAVVV